MNIKESQEFLWKNYSKTDKYKTNRAGIERSKWLVSYLKNIEFNSIFEVGCCVGRNLKHIHKAFPDIKIGGLDINEKSLKHASKILPDANFYNISIYDMPDDKYDVVFTMGVLIHIPDIESVIKKMIDKADKCIIHIERQGNNEVITGPDHTNPTRSVSETFHWAPDIKGVYEGLGFKPVVAEMPTEINDGGATHIVYIEVGE